ncbi:hypothetical protein JY464_18645, partial [Stenotrophomonas maltophilia]|nr:hypothetical protein [Stenotrophomonas maltophilia]
MSIRIVSQGKQYVATALKVAKYTQSPTLSNVFALGDILEIAIETLVEMSMNATNDRIVTTTAARLLESVSN